MNYPNSLIESNPDYVKPNSQDLLGRTDVLEISEFFCDTIQGENFVGYPAAFLRLQHCTLNCVWCDTQEVWKFGNPYSFSELFSMIQDPDIGLRHKLQYGQHLVITGGSPLKQQFALALFIKQFINNYGFKPFIEVENECTLMPSNAFAQYVDCWNNSPKLSNSGNSRRSRYNPNIIKSTAHLRNSWFKFVVSGPSDWIEIYNDFIGPKLIAKEQVVLMPQGETREELIKNAPEVIKMAIANNVRYSSREHVMLWDKKTGV